MGTTSGETGFRRRSPPLPPVVAGPARVVAFRRPAVRCDSVNRDLLAEFGLDPDVLHLNHGAFGCAPIVVRRAAEALRDRAERNPHRFNGRELPPLIRAARERAAAFLEVEPDSIGLVRNVSEGVSSVLGSLELAPGDDLVLCNHGYGAVRIAAQSWADRRGAKIKIAEFDLGASDEEIVAAYAGQVGPDTRLVVVDQVTAPTATVLPVAAIAAAVEAPVLVDAAHVPGTIRTDIAALGVAHWVGNLHKWAHTPRGTAVLWTRPDLRRRTFPSTINWQLNSGYAESFDHPGTWDYAGWLALGEGLDFWERLGGWDQIRHQADLAGEAQRRLADDFGTSLDGLAVHPAPTMRLVRLPEQIGDDEQTRVLAGRLAEEYGIEAGVSFRDGRAQVRLSAAPYNTIEDYGRLGEAISKIIAG